MEHRLVNTAFYKGRLSTESIRILTILPGEFDEPLRCELRDHTFQEEPHYNAISYCWGTGQPIGEITVNGKSGFGVPEHLCACLRRLRRPEKRHAVWIDALCTNQEDEGEKKQHLMRSRRVFLKAQQTVVWLGELLDYQTVTATDQSRVMPCHIPLGLEKADHRVRDALEAFLDERRQSTASTRVWWKRLWCLHEFAVSTTEPVVSVGPYLLKWALFAHLARDVLDPLFYFLNDAREIRSLCPCTLNLQKLRILTEDTFYYTEEQDRDDALRSILRLYKSDSRCGKSITGHNARQSELF
jgi:hypothetical protein